MPALNIYVTDDLKRRMAQINANWSDVCRKAIETELLRRENHSLSSFKVEDVKEWITEELDPINEHNGVVIKPYLHTNSKTGNQVKVLSEFYEEIISEIKRNYLNSIQSTFETLLNGKYQVELLFPGREWTSGTLNLKILLLLNTPKTVEIIDDVIQAEFLSEEIDTPLLESGLPEVSIKNDPKLTQIINYIDIDPDIENYQQKNFEIPELPSEIYSIFRKAWKNLYGEQYCNPPKPLTANELKRLWKEWYYPQAREDSQYWLDRWQNRYKSDKCIYEWENIVASFIFALNGEKFDPSFSEIPEELESWDDSDLLFLSFIEYTSKFIYDGKLLNLTQIDLSKLSTVELSNRDELPEQSGIYFVLGKSDEIHYIGMSINLQKRWYSHHRQEDFDLIENGKIAFITSFPIHYLKEIESVLIKSFLPRLNIRLKPKM